MSGFTMLEVMISIVILAFGLLGIAGLQAFALKNTQSASLRLTATTLANDMIDRVKSNWQGIETGAYNKPNSGDYGNTSGCTTPGSTCTAAQVAQNDLFEWQTRVGATLPGGVGIVCRDSTPDDGNTAGAPGCDDAGTVGYVVKIWWNDDRTSREAVVPLQRFWTPFNP
jgi:type IV pilus assembly protein PilV